MPRRSQRQPFGLKSKGPLYLLLHQILATPNKPPVTLLIIMANVLLFLRPAELPFRVPALETVCLNPHAVLHQGQWSRLLWSPLIHSDELHLYYNMASFLWKGSQLEPRLGAIPFAMLVGELALVANGIYVALAVSALPNNYTSCVVGFSSVLFALKVILTHNAPGWSRIWGISIPTKYSAWLELVGAQLLIPNVSFWGHVSGIVAGLLHVHVIQTFMSRLGTRRGQTYGRGTWG